MSIAAIKKDIYEIHYMEPCFEAAMGLIYFVDCRLTAKGEELTHLEVRIGTERGQALAPEFVAMPWQNTRESSASFKVFCESGAK